MPMTVFFIKQLHEDHDRMRGLLDRLQAQSDLFFERRQPDWEVIESVIRYAAEYPRRFHHRLENLIYRCMAAIDREKAEGAHALIAQHADIPERANGLYRSLQSRQAANNRGDDTFATAMREFIHAYRRHMIMEEEFFFPGAEIVLARDGWKKVQSEWAQLQTAI
jgi:hemerythrin-like domain-containing protein